jgi:hypothetical protein
MQKVYFLLQAMLIRKNEIADKRQTSGYSRSAKGGNGEVHVVNIAQEETLVKPTRVLAFVRPHDPRDRGAPTRAVAFTGWARSETGRFNSSNVLPN